MPQFQDDIDDFMSKRKTTAPKPAQPASDDIDSFMSKRTTPTPAPTPFTGGRKVSPKDTAKYPTPVTAPSLAGNPTAKQSPTGYIDNVSVNDPNSPVGGPMSWQGTKVDSQGRPGRGMVRHEAPAPTAKPSQFKSPVSMDFRAPTDIEQMVNRSQVATGKVAPAPTEGQTGRSAFQQIRQRRSPLEQYQEEQAAQRGRIAGSMQLAEPQTVTPEERRTASEKFIAQNAADKTAQQAEAKARVEAEAARAPKDAFSKIGGHFVRGAVKGVTAPLSMAAATDKTTLGRQAFSDAVQGVEDKAAEYFPVDRTNPATLNVFKPEFYSLSNIGRAATENVPETIGQMLPAIALSRGASAAAGLAAPELATATALPRLMPAVTGAELASRTAAGAYGAMNQAQQAYQNAINAGFSHEDALRAAALEAPIGASEFLGSPGTTGAVRPRTMIGREMREEGLQELGQNVAGDLMAKYGSGYGANKSLKDIAGEGLGSGVLGAAVGGLGALPGAAREGRMTRAENNAVRSESAPMQGIRPTTTGPTNIIPITRTAAAAPPATTTPAIEPTISTPVKPEPSANPPVAAESQSSAFPRLPEPEGFNARRAKLLGIGVPTEVGINERLQQADKLANSPNENDQKLGKRMLKQTLADIQKSEGYQVEIGLPDDAPKPYTAVRQAIEERLKPAPKQAEPEPVAPDVANTPTAELPAPRISDTGQRLIEQTRQKADMAIEEGRYSDALLELKAHQQALKEAKTAARKSPGLRVQLERQIGQVGNRIGEVRKMDREAKRQASVPTAGLPAQKPTQVEKTPLAPQVDTAPLLRPEAVQNPEGGIPQMPEQTFSGRLDQGIRKRDAQKPPAPAKRLISRIQELGGISNRYGGELQGVKDAQRIGVVRNKAEMSPDILARQLQSEGYDIDPENLDTLWRAIDRDISTKNERPANTADLNQRLKDEEADYYAQQEEAANEPTKSFDQIDEEVQAEFNPNEELDARTLQEVRNFGKKPKAIPVKYEPPKQMRTVGNRPMTIDVAGTRTPSAMSAEFPRARRAMVQAGREVEARLKAGQEKGEFGNFANAMFKSNSPDVLHGQDSFFHDPDVKGKLGLTRDAEMADVRKELKTQLARSLGVTVDEVSLSHIKPEVWRAWARQKGLGDVAMRKLEAGIARAEGKENAIKTNAQIVAEESQRGKSEVREPEGKASEPAPIKTGDSVTWKRGDVTESGTVTKIASGYVTYKKPDDTLRTVPVAQVTTAPKIRERKTPGFFSQLTRVIDQKMPAKASAAQVRAIIENPQSGVKPDEIKWTGLDDYLRGKEAVTKAEVQEFLKANQVEVQEVEKGGYQKEVERLEKQINENLDQVDSLNEQWRRKEISDELHGRLFDEIDKINSKVVADRKRLEDLNRTKFGQYVLPGGKEGSYRELLLTLPEKTDQPLNISFEQYLKQKGVSDAPRSVLDSLRRDYENDLKSTKALRNQNAGYRSSHFDEPNILAHLRFNERTDSEGKRVMHVEEIQSDWHQEGRKKGYQRPLTGPELAELRDLGTRGMDNDLTPAEDARWRELDSLNKRGNQGVPDAPFKKNWHELAFKRALRYAAENGYDKMTWTTGEQQADRFDLSKQVSEVHYSEKEQRLMVNGLKGELVLNKEDVSPSKLEDYVGKETASKLLQSQPQKDGWQSLKGDNLKVGGEGMKGFYDSILPAFANKYGRKWGVKVGEAKVAVGKLKPQAERAEMVTPDVLRQAAKLVTDDQSIDEYNRKSYLQAFDKEIARVEGGAKPFFSFVEPDMAMGAYVAKVLDFNGATTETVHSIDITPAMRESVMQGQALFQKGNTPTAADALTEAKIQFKSGKRGQAGTLYANDMALHVIRAAYEQSHGEQAFFENVNMNKTAARKIAAALTAEVQSGNWPADMKRSLRRTAREFNYAAQSGETVSIVQTGSGRGFGDIKISRRHELFHDAQEGLQNSKGFLARHEYGQKAIDSLAKLGYEPEDRTVEAAAFVASGDARRLGLTDEQGKAFLKDYFDDIVANNGREALERFVSLSPKVQGALKEARAQNDIQGKTGKVVEGKSGSAETGRPGTNGEAARSGERVPERVREQKRASFGELENEPKGPILGAFPGNLQGLFRRGKPKPVSASQPAPLPKNFDINKWSPNFYREAMSRGLNEAELAQYKAAKTARDKDIVLLNASIDPAHEKAIFDIIDNADKATLAGDGGVLYDAMVQATDMLSKKPKERGYQRAKVELGNALGLPRALMASADISAPLRQGAILTLPPSQWGKAAKATVRMFQSFSTAKYKEISKQINLHPDAEVARESGLHLGSDKSGLVTKREEDFISSWADKVPIVKHSEQAYKAYLDSLRMDTFARYKKSIDKTKGLSAEQKESAYKAAADWINVATGRGTLGQTFEDAMPILSKAMFAPRYTASRIQVLNPMTYAKNARTPEGRAVLKNQMADMVQYAGMVSATLALAAANGATVGLDPDDPDFLKIKIGNIRYDTLAGLQQPMRLFYRMGASLYGRSTGQKVERNQSTLDIATRFARSKLAPVPSFFWDFFSGKDFTGQDFKLSKAVADRVIPLMWKDFYDAYQKEGIGTAAMVLPSALGIGVQNYGEKTGAIEQSKFTSEAEKMGHKYEFMKKKPDEPESIYKQRVDRVSGWMDYYGGMLLNDPRYQSLPPDMQEAAIQNLRKRIGRQQNIAQPKIDRRTGQIESFTPGKVLEGVNKSVRERPKRQAKNLWNAP